MQIFALDNGQRLIHADHAEKQADYFCRECGGVVRLRGGIHRKNHFFHLGPPPSCKESKKSLPHLQVQSFLKTLIPCGECELERHFPEIGRIADAVWAPRKLVFEVQCSHISKEEVEQRNRDYKELGYKVIWILHDKRFNRWRASAAEIFLRDSPHYFTDMDSRGKGSIYDQIDALQGGVRRTFRRIPSVALQAPLAIPFPEGKESLYVPASLGKRLREWPLHFEGDLIDLFLKGEKEVLNALEKAAVYENSFYRKAATPFFGVVRKFLHRFILRPYTILLQTLLEKSCR